MQQGAHPRQHRCCILARTLHVSISASCNQAVVDADAEPAHPSANTAKIIRHGFVDSSRVIWIRAGYGSQYGSRIGRAAGHWPDMVQGLGESEHPCTADPSPARLQPCDAIHRRGEANRPQRIRAKGAVAKPAAVATPGPLDEIPVQCAPLHGLTGGSIEG